MKLSDVVYKTYEEVAEMPRFDFAKRTRKTSQFVKPLLFLLSFVEYTKRKTKVTKINMKGLKPPYILLCNHNAYFDFKVEAMNLLPHAASNVVAVDGFFNRENILRLGGSIGKRKLINYPLLVLNIKHILKNKKGIVGIYPEARYSFVGTNSSLPDSLGKMVKMLDVPVVVLLNHGHHLSQPFWNLKKRKNRTESEMTQILTKEDVKKLSAEEISDKINSGIVYDDYAWQKQNNIIIDEPFRAEGLHLPLFKCPVCKDEHHMTSKGTELICENCQSKWHLTELGQLESKTNTFTHIPDWFNWQRTEVKKEIEAGTYHFEDDVMIDSLPNAKGMYRLGKGHAIHNENGFLISGEFSPNFKIEMKPQESYSLHVEYKYFGKGNCFILSTLNDSYFIYPLDQKNSVTKLYFGVEEVFNNLKNKK
ncbi:MAG: hypothetical protein GX807_03325 [Erysipelotrichia bacterium]|nr:hypothetical protein [Erysipelotrichia bacterium]